MNIDLENYNVQSVWLEDSRNFNYINKWVNTKNKKIIKTKEFKPLLLMIKIYPKVPFETVYTMHNSNTKLLNKNKKSKQLSPKEEKIIYEPFKLTYQTDDKKRYIVKMKISDDNNSDIEITKYDMMYNMMISDAITEIEKKFENSSDIINILYKNNFNLF